MVKITSTRRNGRGTSNAAACMPGVRNDARDGYCQTETGFAGLGDGQNGR